MTGSCWWASINGGYPTFRREPERPNIRIGVLDLAEQDDSELVQALVGTCLDALETMDLGNLDRCLDQHSVIFLPTGRGSLQHLKIWAEVKAALERILARSGPSLAQSFFRVQRREAIVEIKGSTAFMSLRSGPDDSWIERAVALNKAGGRWRIRHLQLGNLGLSSDEFSDLLSRELLPAA